MTATAAAFLSVSVSESEFLCLPLHFGSLLGQQKGPKADQTESRGVGQRMRGRRRRRLRRQGD